MAEWIYVRTQQEILRRINQLTCMENKKNTNILTRKSRAKHEGDTNEDLSTCKDKEIQEFWWCLSVLIFCKKKKKKAAKWNSTIIPFIIYTFAFHSLTKYIRLEKDNCVEWCTQRVILAASSYSRRRDVLICTTLSLMDHTVNSPNTGVWQWTWNTAWCVGFGEAFKLSLRSQLACCIRGDPNTETPHISSLASELHLSLPRRCLHSHVKFFWQVV